jgi:hypothetical protein
MKKLKIQYYKFFFLLAAFPAMLPGQVLSDSVIKEPVEKLEIITDRDIYAVNEEVFFRIYNISAPELIMADWSKVIYVELITPEGHAVSQKKLISDSRGCSGSLALPAEIISGNYYLRAYTRWMRNFPEHYSYKAITIINAAKKAILPAITKPADNFNAVSITVTGIQSDEIRLNKSVFKIREKVSVELIPDNGFLEKGDYTISVIRSKALIFNQKLNEITPLRTNSKFIPETRGISISGKIINDSDSLPLRDRLVHLTVLTENPQNFGILSDKEGEFYFSLPELYDETEVFINTAITNDREQVQILVDNDFCNRLVELPYLPLNTSDTAMQFYNEVGTNAQLRKIYTPGNTEKVISVSATAGNDQNSFYGKPDFSLVLKDYIPLPTLEDYFKELIPLVSIRHQNRMEYFQVNGDYYDLKVYEPLVLVDMVAISNASKILDISPRSVKQIDVVNRPYIRGDIIYGGIIQIISDSGDFAGVNLPSSGRFFNYKMADTPQYHYTINPPAEKNLPDTRNCLYWNASFTLLEGKSTGFDFYTGDTTGEYSIILRGFDPEGNYVECRKIFWVE